MRGNPNPDKDNASVDPVSSALTGRENAKTPRSEVEPNPTPTSIVPEPCSEALIGATHKRQETAEEDNTETELQRLALLDPLEYDRERNEAAKRLGAQLKTLDAEVTKRRPKTNSTTHNTQRDGSIILRVPDPCPEPVDGAQLLDEIAKSLAQYSILPPGAATTIALWILMTYVHDCFSHSPILTIQSPEKRCGKTTLLTTISHLVLKPLPTSNVTPAALFRAVELSAPTLLIDEADTFLGKGNSDLKGILNSGFSKCSASVLRCDGDDHNSRQFSTWCPKLIALIGNLPDTLEDRAIPIRLRRKLADEQVQRFAEHRDAGRLSELASKAARWDADNYHELLDADPDLPTGLNDREMDCWRPLIAIADAAGGEWPTKARNASRSLCGTSSDDDEGSIREQLLSNIKQVFDDTSVSSIQSSKLVEKLTENETWPWGEWRGGHPISARGLARLLKPFGIKPRKASFANEYWEADFEDAWARYLHPTDPGPPSATSTSSTPHERELKNNGLDARGTSHLSSTRFDRMEHGSNPQATENIDEWNLGSLEPGTAAQESNSKGETNGFTTPEGICSDPTSMESEWTEEL